MQVAMRGVQITVQTIGSTGIMDGMLIIPSKFHVVRYYDII